MADNFHLPTGFRFAGISTGIKASGKLDFGIVVADRPSVAAGLLTTNIIRAASIDYCRSILPSDSFRAVVINSGNSNACTGQTGKENNLEISTKVAEEMGTSPEAVAVLSTGIIGHPLPMDKIRSGIPNLVSAVGESVQDFQLAATAITTTDKHSKTASVQFEVQGETYKIAVMAKGAGMIGPNMATMLCVVVTDFPLDKQQAQETLRVAADQSFNSISVEGHMSTSDAMLMMSSGSNSSPAADSLAVFQQHLNAVTLQCAKMIPADGEGATHLVRIHVTGASSDEDANTIARSIANSALVKTAIYGNDPNWGRIVSAAGYTSVEFEPHQVSLQINGTELFASGTPTTFDEAAVSKSMAAEFETNIELSVGTGTGTATHWTSDLTVDYVRFNSDYST